MVLAFARLVVFSGEEDREERGELGDAIRGSRERVRELERRVEGQLGQLGLHSSPVARAGWQARK